MQLSLFPELQEQEYKEQEALFISIRDKLKKNNAYSKDEERYQQAQEHWEKYGDLKSWHVMYIQIQKACFNRINKKLCGKIPNSDIEDYSHDVTTNIMNGLMAKKLRGEFWKIAKLSAFVHLPCLVIFQKQKQFEDKVLDESAYTYYHEGEETIKENENSYFKDGIYHI